MSDINPLFVIEAEQLLLENKYEDCISLCNQGLIEYPEYITAWGILVQAYINNHDIDKANSTLDKVLIDYPDNNFLTSLKEQITKDNINSELHDKTVEKNINQIDNDLEDKNNSPTDEIEKEELLSEHSEQEKEEILKAEVTEIENINKELTENSLDQKPESKDKIISENIPEETKIPLDDLGILEKSYKSFIEYIKQPSEPKLLNSLYNQLDIIPGLNEIDFINNNILSIERKSFKLFNDIPDFPDIKLNFEKEKINPNNILNQISDDLTQLATNLENATIPKVKETKDKEEYSNTTAPIVSETMAKIYAQQGAYEQAAQAYRDLIKQNPEKKDYFTEKLNNIISK